MNEAASGIYERVHKDANDIFGVIVDNDSINCKYDVTVTMLATCNVGLK